MRKTLALPALTAALFLVGGIAHAAVIGQQTDSSTETVFVSNTPGLLGQHSNTFTLPAMTGLLKAYDLYLSLSSFNFTAGFQAAPTSVRIIFGGADCPSTGGSYSASGLGIPVLVGPSGNTVVDPLKIHFTLDQTDFATYAGQTDCTVQLISDNASSAKAMATQSATGTPDLIYFVGYNALGTPPTITHVMLSSDNASSTVARAGDHVRLDFDVDEAVRTPQVTIAGRAAAVATTTGNSFEASTTLAAGDTEGQVTFDIQVLSLLGDDAAASTTTDGTQVVVDTTPPHLTADSRITNEQTPLVGGAATDTPSGLASVSVTVNGSVYTAALAGDSWSVLLPALPEGTYPIAATATDTAGNQSQAQGTLTIDRTAPVLAITGGPANGSFTNQTSATFTFTSDTPTLCSLDGGALAACSSPYTLLNLAPGTHLFSVSASDEAGNTTSQTRSWSVDTAAPILKEVAIATSTSDTTPTYVFSSSKAGTITYGGSCTSTTTTAAAGDNTISFNTLAPGTYSDCTILVTDSAGNMSAPFRVSTFTINIATPPRHPANKDECKDGGWRTFTDPKYKNQGDCVSDVVSHAYKDDSKDAHK